MSASGARKAAMLLMSLDTSSAAELLKAVRPEHVHDIVAEMACLRSAGGKGPPVPGDPVREFVQMLVGRQGGPRGDSFLKDLLDKALGAARGRELLSKAGELVQSRDPFGPLRTAEAPVLAGALEGESPSVVALVLAELPPKKSSDLLARLGEEVRLEAVRQIAAGEQASAEVRRKVAQTVIDRLKAPAAQVQDRREQQCRKVAVLLRILPVELRNKMLQSMISADPDTGKAVQQAMVTWQDIVDISDRSLQEALRGLDTRKLALAMVKADAALARKIRSNMSDRAGARLDEESSLLSAPRGEDVQKAREEIVSQLRELNANNQISFEET